MTMTTTEAIAAVEAVLAQLQAAEVAPLASNLPPRVSAGELITSAWGNAVVDELARLRQEMTQSFAHGGGSSNVYGTFDNGTTVLGPFTYPVRVTVISLATAGYGASGILVSGDIVRLSDGASVKGSATAYARSATYANMTIPAVYDVPAGQAAGFKTRTIFSASDATPITCYYGASGTYHVQRTDVA